MATLPASAISLFHFENNLTDTLGNASVSNSGTTLSTTQKKFGSYSAYFNGTGSSGNYLDITLSSAAYATIEYWVYRTNNDTALWWPTPFSSYPSGAGDRGIYTHVFTPDASYYPTYAVGSTTGYNWESGNGSTKINTNQWYHIAITKSGTTYKYYLDGILQVTLTQANPPSSTHICLGGLRASSGFDGYSYFKGYVDELMVATAVTRTDNFTPPTDAYADTIVIPNKSFFFGMNF